MAHIIKKYYASQNDQEDLISIGTIGLIKAIDTFDPAKGIRLSSYASRCIENEILMFFRSGRKSAQDVSLNEPIDTDKEGNALTILDTMAVDDTIVESIDTKMKSEKLYRFLQSSLNPGSGRWCAGAMGCWGLPPSPSGWWQSAWAFPAATSPALRKRPWRSCASSSSRSACCRALALSPGWWYNPLVFCEKRGGKPMEAKKKYLVCERRSVFALLTLSAGMMGAYTFNLRGGVFCNAQTANVVLMAIAFGSGAWGQGCYYLIPITAYLAGAFLSEILPSPVRRFGFLRWGHLPGGL